MLAKLGTWLVLCGVWMLTASAAQAQEPAAAPPPGRQPETGRLIRIESPITSGAATRAVRMAKTAIADAKRLGQWPVIVFEIEPGQSSFGAALDLASAIIQLDGATTVAYIPKTRDGEPVTLRGHAVLVALACDRIVMSADSRIGEAGVDESIIGPHIRAGYLQIAASRRTAPEDLVLGMLDPDLEIFEVESDVSREFVRADRLEQLQKEKTLVVRRPAFIPRGQAGMFTGEQARRLGIVRHLADDRFGLAKELGLPVQSVQDDPSLNGGWRPAMILVDQPLTPRYLGQIQRKIQQQIDSQDANLLVLAIDTAGGAPSDSLALANYLNSIDPALRRTVAYVTGAAQADAAILALACDQIVMAPTARIGGSLHLDRDASDDRQFEDDENPGRGRKEAYLQAVQKLCTDNGRSYSVPLALFDSGQSVYRYTRKSDGLISYMTEAEVQAQPDPAQWTQGDAVLESGTAHVLDGHQAQEFGLAAMVQNESELKMLLGVDGNFVRVQTDWVDSLVDGLGEMLNRPLVMFLLMVIGFTAFYAEMQSPGIGVGGFIAVVCFLLFFWGNYLGGTAGWLEILLFIVGMTFLLLEIFVLPGFGVFGIGGAAMVLASLVMALQSFSGLHTASEYLREVRNSMAMVVAAFAGVILLAAALRYYLPKSSWHQSMLVLAPPGSEAGEMAEASLGYQHLLNQRGVAVTQLTPSGKVRVGSELVNVVSDGDYIVTGQSVIVTEVHGHRIVVRAV